MQVLVFLVTVLFSSISFSYNPSIFLLTDYRNTYTGTGFELNYKGTKYTITNAHICDQNKLLIAEIPGNRFKLLLVKKVYSKHDLCVLYPVDTLPALDMATDWSYHDKVSVEGFPLGRHGYSKGIIDRMLMRDHVYVIYYGPVFPGNSGSPVLNKDGKVIGVIAIGDRLNHSFGGFVPMEFLKDFLDNIDKPEDNKCICGGANGKEVEVSE